jgi:hypothetical protein
MSDPVTPADFAAAHAFSRQSSTAKVLDDRSRIFAPQQLKTTRFVNGTNFNQ